MLTSQSPSKGRAPIIPTGRERLFGKEEIIISKTDAKGKITYANDLFCKISGYKSEQLIGKPHNIIRHPDMPRCIFRLMWERVEGGEDIYVYVKNLVSNGDHYWVIAKVSPLLSEQYSSRLSRQGYNIPKREIVGFLSYRRSPDHEKVKDVEQLYQLLRRVEQQAKNINEGTEAAYQMMTTGIAAKGLCYDDVFKGFENLTAP
jgi:PAS domain S-box-containing protein